MNYLINSGWFLLVCYFLYSAGTLVVELYQSRAQSKTSKRKNVLVTKGSEGSKQSFRFPERPSSIFNVHWLIVGCILFASVSFADRALGQSFDGLPLPPSVSQETYDLIIGSDPTDPVYGCFPHYYHCALENSLLKGTYQAPPTYSPAEPTDENFSCTRTLSWGRGDLWKPVSERGKPVVLLPCEYNSARSVTVFSGDKENQVAVGNSRNYCKNGDRSHFDITSKANELPKDSILVVLLNDGSVECRNLPDPTRRYE